MCVFICMCILVYMYVYRCTRVYVYVCGMCMYTGVCSCEFMCSAARCSVSDSFVRSGLGNRRIGFVPLWTRHIDDSKTDPWDDLEVRTGSRSEDQIAIRFQNCIISVSICSCIIFLLYRC